MNAYEQMRDALEYVLQFDTSDDAAMTDGLTDAERIMELASHIDECQKRARAALSVPARNCDFFESPEDELKIWYDYDKWCRRPMNRNIDNFPIHSVIGWLLAPAAERKGEVDGK